MELRKIRGAIALFLLLQIIGLCNSLPLSTQSRFIVDSQTGNRVKLACVNWPSHLQPMIAEGLEKKPVSYIAKKIRETGFNCVRFTWATYMFTRPDYGLVTVEQSLDILGLLDAKAGVAKHNPQFLKMTVLDVHRAVVNELGKNRVMVVLDNHVSMPKWCCGRGDGNGFFGDKYFDPNEWVLGLSTVARRYRNHPWVVAMSMRNELRGSNQTTDAWHKYVRQGAATIHLHNPNVLVIVSGLDFEKNLEMLNEKPFATNYDNKLVFEAHWYAFGTGKRWLAQPNQMCRSETHKFSAKNAFVLTEGAYPLFVSEFGIDQRGTSVSDNRYMTCFLAAAALYDFDWALWAFQGSYIFREGKLDMNEVYGVMNHNWDNVRNPAYIQRMEYIRRANLVNDATNKVYWLMYHPHTGLCVHVRQNGSLILGSCANASRWEEMFIRVDRPIKLSDSNLCLQMEGEGKDVKATSDCSSKSSTWRFASASGLHLAARHDGGQYLCLDVNPSDNSLITRKCACLNGNLEDHSKCEADPEGQWFSFVPANVREN